VVPKFLEASRCFDVTFGRSPILLKRCSVLHQRQFPLCPSLAFEGFRLPLIDLLNGGLSEGHERSFVNTEYN
jgi:hypothetical protein